MNLSAAILAAALSLPSPWRSPEPEDAYRARLETIATAVAIEAQAATSVHALELAVAVLTIWAHESRFALDVHSGERTGDLGRARCLGQVHPSGIVPRREWLALTGTDLASTRRCARATVRVFAAQARRCVGTSIPLSAGAVARAFAGYGTGGSCAAAPWARKRARTWGRLLDAARRPPPPPSKPAAES